jgi:hypothetical protein
VPSIPLSAGEIPDATIQARPALQICLKGNATVIRESAPPRIEIQG